MRRAAVVLVGLVLVLLGLVGPTAPGSAAPPAPRAGTAGIGDPYFPLDGNGGYDVEHYDLAVDYRPATDRLRGTARITAKATRALSRFNLDLQGLEVDRIRVDGRRATWSRKGQELRITPSRSLRAGQRFHVTVRYHGVPRLLDESVLGRAGVFPTADGAIIIGEPHVAATWFPVNDHPRDKATYRIKVTVPRGLEAVSNGRLVKKRHHGGSSTWTWVMAEPMASYLATATVGQFRLTRDRADGVRIMNAIDPALFAAPAPRTGHRFVGSGADDSAYKRLSRVLEVPARGGRMTFYVDRSTEPDFDYFFVEARRVGSSAWTTLPDLRGHTTPSTGLSCPFWLDLHPFLRHYQSGDEEGGCVPRGTTGQWNAATGASRGYERWSIDLGAYAGRSVEVSLSVVSDDAASYRGVYVDDIVVPGGRGSTSFEWDRSPFDGWRVSGPPAGSPGNPGDWRRASKALSPSTGERAAAALEQQPQILRFLRGVFGPYPFRDAGGIVDDDPDFGFALENQTRPIYSKVFFSGPVDDDSTGVVVHELAHQWTGNSLSVEAWQHIWLNEGFATYAEWLWSEHRGDATAQQIFDSLSGIPAEEDFFWGTVIADPGPEQLFHPAVYYRGAMTLHALRLQVGDDRFFSLLERWTACQRYGNVTTAEFQALAEQVAGQDLDTFFRTWLFTPTKPAGLGPATTSRAQTASPSRDSWQKLVQQQRR